MNFDDIKNIKEDECITFSSFAKPNLPLPGDKKKLDDILNKEIIIVDYRITDSKKRPNTKCLEIQFKMDGRVYVVFTGSNVLLDQVQRAGENMPFKTTIVKIDKYFSLS